MVEINGVQFETENVTIPVLKGSNLPTIWKEQAKRQFIKIFQDFAYRKLYEAKDKEQQETYKKMIAAGFAFRKVAKLSKEQLQEASDLKSEIDSIETSVINIRNYVIPEMRINFSIEQNKLKQGHETGLDATIALMNMRKQQQKALEAKEQEVKDLLSKIPALDKKIDKINSNPAVIEYVPVFDMAGNPVLKDEN